MFVEKYIFFDIFIVFLILISIVILIFCWFSRKYKKLKTGLLDSLQDPRETFSFYEEKNLPIVRSDRDQSEFSS